MPDKKETQPGAMDDDAIKRRDDARKAQEKAIEEALDTDNSAAWNRGRNAADPSRKKTTKRIRTT
jgi:hypothetical protein